jgi:hypothetical protein
MYTPTSSDQMENIHLLNILNWSTVENFVSKTTTTNETESIFKHSYNAVQLSIELQKKMLK